ncbi:MAG TPA: hypothetical protein VMV69_17425, partial [Pirellulales bacterium]|nr:hypothetical protein [Pirellulales bacterium]
MADLRKLESAKAANERAIDGSLGEQKQVRAKLDRKRTELSRYFDLTLKRLLGPDAGGLVEIDARGIYPRPAGNVAPNGEAMSTWSTVLGFDLVQNWKIPDRRSTGGIRWSAWWSSPSWPCWQERAVLLESRNGLGSRKI